MAFTDAGIEMLSVYVCAFAAACLREDDFWDLSAVDQVRLYAPIRTQPILQHLQPFVRLFSRQSTG